jgi:hypothetical protein
MGPNKPAESGDAQSMAAVAQPMVAITQPMAGIA